MRRIFAVSVAVAAVALSLFLAPRVDAMTARTAPGVQKSLAQTSQVERVVRVCRHDFWTSRRVCFTDRSRPPTVCHHLTNSSRLDCY